MSRQLEDLRWPCMVLCCLFPALTVFWLPPLEMDSQQRLRARCLTVEWAKASPNTWNASCRIPPLSSTAFQAICHKEAFAKAGLPLPGSGEVWLMRCGSELLRTTDPAPFSKPDPGGGILRLHPCRDCRIRILKIACVSEPWRESLQGLLAERLEQGTGQAGPWLKAMLLGMRGELAEEEKSDMRRSGLAHLLAVSGLHVGVLVLVFQRLARIMTGSHRQRILLLLILLPCYVWLCGASVSVQRAACMAGLYLLSRFFGRNVSGFQLLLGACFLLLLLKPEQVLQPGFQLSVTAVAALLSMKKDITPPAEGSLPQRFLKMITSMLHGSWRIQLATAPVLLAHFHQLAPAGLLLNLLAIPLASLLVVTGVLHLLLPLPAEPLGALASTLAALLAACPQLVPTPVIQWAPAFPQLALISLGCLLLLAELRIRFRVTMAGALILLAADLLPALARPAAGAVMFAAGQGDAVLLSSPAGRHTLVDCGWTHPERPKGCRRGLLEALDRLASEGLDWLILSHPDQDHIGGARAVLEHLPVRRVLFNGEWKQNPTQDSLRAFLAESAIPLIEASPGQFLQLEQDWKLKVLGPPPADGPCEEGNERSIVLMAESARESLLMTADAGFAEEAWLLGWGSQLRARWLKLGHHGSHGSSSEAFLEEVRAEEAWISCGAANRYGHPDQEVIQRCRELGMAVWRTDRAGYRQITFSGTSPPLFCFSRPRLSRIHR